MAITIDNLRIVPYTQKSDYKPIYGDTLDFSFVLPSPHAEGDKYLFGADFERVVYPPMRPLCAYTEDFSVSTTDAGQIISLSLVFLTARFRDWVSTLKKPTPITLQLVRVRDGVQDTLLLDDILALPSVVDGENVVYPGDPLQDLLDAKLDKPEEDGHAGQYLGLDADGKPVWKSVKSEDYQADWDESDSDEPSYIRNKPDLAALEDKISLAFEPSVRTTSDASISLASADMVVAWSPAGDATLSVVALPSAGYQRSWEVRLELAQNATLTLGSGIAFATDADGVADAVTGGAVNILLVRATSDGANVYVCGTEEAIQ